MDKEKFGKNIKELSNILGMETLNFLDKEYKETQIDSDKRNEIINLVMSGHLNSLFLLLMATVEPAKNKSLNLRMENFIEKIKNFIESQPEILEVENIGIGE